MQGSLQSFVVDLAQRGHVLAHDGTNNLWGNSSACLSFSHRHLAASGCSYRVLFGPSLAHPLRPAAVFVELVAELLPLRLAGFGGAGGSLTLWL